MVLLQIKEDLPSLVKECDIYCRLIADVRKDMARYYDENFNPFKELDDPTHPLGGIKKQYENPFLEGHINVAKREISLLEKEILRSEHNIAPKSENGHVFDRLKKSAKECYNSLMNGVYNRNGNLVYHGVKQKNGSIKNVYFIKDDTERDELIILASAAIAYSIRAIEIAKARNLKVNIIKYHFRNAECYDFLGSSNAKEEYQAIADENEKSAEGYAGKGLHETKKKLTEKIIAIAYEKLGKASETEDTGNNTAKPDNGPSSFASA